MAPRGPRGSNSGRGARNSTGGAKPSSRGGIQKRRGPSRVDGDGDLDMDASGKRGNKTTTAGSNGSRSRPAPRSSAPRNPRGVSNAAQTVLKHLKGGDSSNLASRISDPAGRTIRGRGKATGLSYLRVHGLKQSKAASNSDGGLKDLLNFLERKASSFNAGRPARQVMIRKVSPNIDGYPACRREAIHLAAHDAIRTNSCLAKTFLEECKSTRRPQSTPPFG